MDKITHEVRLTQWKKVIEECRARPEGQTAKSWLSERGISEKCFYYCQHKLRLHAYGQMQPPPSFPAAPIHRQNARFPAVSWFVSFL